MAWGVPDVTVGGGICRRWKSKGALIGSGLLNETGLFVGCGCVFPGDYVGICFCLPLIRCDRTSVDAGVERSSGGARLQGRILTLSRWGGGRQVKRITDGCVRMQCRGFGSVEGDAAGHTRWRVYV